MNTELKQTKDHGLFAHNEYQQPMSEAHVASLIESMNKYGFLPSKPLTVVDEGQWLRVIDGHHRLEAAKRGGFSVFYIVESKSKASSIGDINRVVRKWSNLSFAKMYALKGSADYIELLQYVNRGIALKQASSLLVGQAAHSGNVGESVQDGTFKIKTRRIIDSLLNVFDVCEESAPAVKSRVFVEAFSTLYFVDQFDPSLLAKKILTNPRMMVKCATREQMIDVIDEIYNFRNHAKVPLKLLAQESAMIRQASFGKKK